MKNRVTLMNILLVTQFSKHNTTRRKRVQFFTHRHRLKTVVAQVSSGIQCTYTNTLFDKGAQMPSSQKNKLQSLI